MKRIAFYLILLLIAFFLGVIPYLIYAAPVAGGEKVNKLENKDKENDKTEAELAEQAEKEEKEEVQNDEKQTRLN